MHDSQLLTWISDDGRSRGDGAPVLVAHTSPEAAREFLDDPAAAIGPVLAELPGVLGGSAPSEPLLARAHRWRFASPAHTHEQAFGWLPEALIGVCGDAWGERSRVEQAWLSGDALGSALLAALPVGS